VEDIGATLRDYAGGIQHRLNIWRKSKTACLTRSPEAKVRPDLDAMIAFGADVATKLSDVENKMKSSASFALA